MKYTAEDVVQSICNSKETVDDVLASASKSAADSTNEEADKTKYYAVAAFAKKKLKPL